MNISPACAGVILLTFPVTHGIVDKPRMRGGDSHLHFGMHKNGSFSPHARG